MLCSHGLRPQAASTHRVIALDPVTGRERWFFDPGVVTGQGVPGEKFNCRGLAQWRDAKGADGATCTERLFMATTDRRVIALDARTGALCEGFGARGQVHVPLEGTGLREGELQFASAPAVVSDVIVVGSASGDNGRAFGPAGTVRAFDARNGTQRWTFDPIPRLHDPVASPTWQGNSASRTGQANVWGSITVDPARDLVFLPTSSPSPDFYGGLRQGNNLYANSMVALRGSTGKLVWYFQTVHHDLWDYDIPAGPSLVGYRKEGVERPALVFATKTGFLFVLDRETGQALTEVQQRPVPASDVPGEWTSPTQPFSVGLPVLAPQRVTEDDAFGMMGWDKSAVNLDTGKMAWEVPLGNTRELAPFGLALRYGTPGFGGPIVTDGGVLFIAATLDNLLRAFDMKTGTELWAGQLPNGGQATPMTYAVGSKQYVVIAAGGHPTMGNKIGESLVAFSLPD